MDGPVDAAGTRITTHLDVQLLENGPVYVHAHRHTYRSTDGGVANVIDHVIVVDGAVSLPQTLHIPIQKFMNDESLGCIGYSNTARHTVLHPVSLLNTATGALIRLSIRVGLCVKTHQSVVAKVDF